MATVWKLLALIAVVLLPLGMTTAPAAAAAHHGSMASMPTQHCPEQAPNHHSKSGFAECTMACSAALPAVDLTRGHPLPTACERSEAVAVHILHGLHPDTATPPPKRA